ncbi:hypothetical protein DSO57_1030669 [Entomophthora muscae]|uniref:Uncharacterized protein n=1 Tax=Entomophthora muscae TaxID=34485 RepID=A0ACC2ULU4_9FUNG|nr:hypothetical protein DSO57_1030669 [Entomophthora muscae]
MNVTEQIVNRRFNYLYYEDRAMLMHYSTLMLSLVAFLANGFVLFLARKIKLQWGGFSDQLITYIAAVDLLNSVTMVVAFFGRLALGFPGVFRSNWYCRSVGLLLTVLPCYSMIMISFLACERFYVIKYRKSFDHLVCKTWIIMGGLMILLAVPSLMNAYQNDYSPDPTFSYCWPNSIAPGVSWAYVQNMILTVNFVEPIFVLVFCYVQVAFICMQPIRSAISNINNPSITSFQRQLASQRLSPRGARHSLIFVTFYVLCFGPKVMTTLFFMTGNGSNHPFFLYMINPLFIQLVVCINPILLMFLSKNFRENAIKTVNAYRRIEEPS